MQLQLLQPQSINVRLQHLHEVEELGHMSVLVFLLKGDGQALRRVLHEEDCAA